MIMNDDFNQNDLNLDCNGISNTIIDSTSVNNDNCMEFSEDPDAIAIEDSQISALSTSLEEEQ